MFNQLRASVEKQGGRLGIMSLKQLTAVKAEFDAAGLNTSPYFKFEPEGDLGFAASSVLIVALPSPLASVRFTLDGRDVLLPFPATYIDGDEATEKARNCLSNHGANIAHTTKLPLKPIAAHAGLGNLGRNNTLYVNGMGSFLNLNTFYSDVPCTDEALAPLEMAPACERCDVCVQNCPTGALSAEKRLITSDRCITCVNEFIADFPEWVEGAHHNALIGCLKCQSTCPQNAAYLEPVEIAAFDADQTQAFINGALKGDDLQSFGSMARFYEVLVRNLKALIAAGCDNL